MSTTEDTMSNNIITVHRPQLTAEEREKRMEEIKRAAIRLYIATEKAKKEKENAKLH